MSLADNLRLTLDRTATGILPEEDTLALIALPVLRRALAVVEEIERAPDDDEEHPDKRLLRHMRWRDRLRGMVG